MNIRYRHLRTLAALGTLTTLAFSTVQAGQFGGSENNLIGITLRSSTFRDVLRKYGQPNEVQGGGPFLPTPPKGAAPVGGAGGGMPGSGGIPGSGGGMSSGGAQGIGGGGGGKRATSKNGFPGVSDSAPGGGAPGSGGSPGGGSYPGSGGSPGGGSYPGSGGSPGGGSYPGSGGSPGSGSYPGSGGSPGGGGRGLPGFAGNNGGGPGSAGLPGSGDSAGGDQAAAADRPATEATWWYHNALKGYHMSFLFNKEGRVIQIQEYGIASMHSGKTRQGITLGSNMTQVLSRYGWSNDGAHDGENVIMRYGGADKVAFQMVKNKVLGITVAVGH
jgi:hypothetical protein